MTSHEDLYLKQDALRTLGYDVTVESHAGRLSDITVTSGTSTVHFPDTDDGLHDVLEHLNWLAANHNPFLDQFPTRKTEASDDWKDQWFVQSKLESWRD